MRDFQEHRGPIVCRETITVGTTVDVGNKIYRHITFNEEIVWVIQTEAGFRVELNGEIMIKSDSNYTDYYGLGKSLSLAIDDAKMSFLKRPTMDTIAYATIQILPGVPVDVSPYERALDNSITYIPASKFWHLMDDNAAAWRLNRGTSSYSGDYGVKFVEPVIKTFDIWKNGEFTDEYQIVLDNIEKAKAGTLGFGGLTS